MVEVVTDAAPVAETPFVRQSPSGHVPGRLAIVYTCEVCERRSAKTFSKHAYAKGIVLIRCDGCESLHLIADNLGWFSHIEHGRNIEQMFASMGRNLAKLDAESAQQLVDIEPQIRQFVKQAESDANAGAAASQLAAADRDVSKKVL